jgi:nanoRNase/pAp phosphatase (c-di-AMP/oligoRNAs hydrolase)
MINQNQASQVQSALATAQTIFIVLPQNPNFDQVAAALALYLSLGATKKSVSIGCSTEMTVGFSSLVGVDKIENKLQGGKDSLKITFDYIEEAIEKVSYNIEEGKFNLVVKPKPGHPPLDSDKVKFSYTGGKVNLIFTIGAGSLKSLGGLYQANQEAFKEAQIVNLDNNSRNQEYGQINLIDSSAASLSEEVVQLIRFLRLLTDKDIGTNLYQGIERATNHFSSAKVKADTFEAAAFCLRMGARREVRFSSKKIKKAKSPLKPMTAKVSALKEPVQKKEEESEKPKPDWFEPKIYKGEGRV